MDLALNNLQSLICHKTKPNQTKPNQSNYLEGQPQIVQLESDFKLKSMPKWGLKNFLLDHQAQIRTQNMYVFWQRNMKLLLTNKHFVLANKQNKCKIKITEISVITGAFGTTKYLEKRPGELEVRGRIETIQTTSLLRSTEEICRHLTFRENHLLLLVWELTRIKRIIVNWFC